MKVKKGDYVIATKYKDGDPKDHFVVGFFRNMTWHDRYNIADENGNLFRGNGFRRAKVISEKVGKKIIQNMPIIGQSDRSVWSFVEQFENKLTNTPKD